MADATAAVAGGVVGAAVKGVIGGIQGTADGIGEGWRKGSQSVVGRPGEAWVEGDIGGVQGAARESATGGNAQSVPPAEASPSPCPSRCFGVGCPIPLIPLVYPSRRRGDCGHSGTAAGGG